MHRNRGRTVAESIRQRFVQWQIDELLFSYPGLRVVPTTGGYVKITGALAFIREAPGKERIEDEYLVEITIPYAFPKCLLSVRETGRRIPRWYHTLRDGTLCLGSPTRLRFIVSGSASVLRFVERCVVPYLYGYSYFERHKSLPFGELQHGISGLREDLASLFGVDDERSISSFVRLAAMRKRQANKHSCPCGSSRRLGRCHHRRVNELRARLSRRWFCVVRHSLGAMPDGATANAVALSRPAD
jgi:hypothetical protein